MKHFLVIIIFSLVFTSVNAQKIRTKKEKYDNRQIKSIGDYDHTFGFFSNRERGFWKYYYENGQLEMVGNYGKYGEKVGEWKFYYENGQLSSNRNYGIDGGDKLGIWKSYYKDGTLKEVVSYQDGNKTGLWNSYWDNGELRVTGEYKKGEQIGLWKYYDKYETLVETKDYDFLTGKKYFIQGQYSTNLDNETSFRLIEYSANRGYSGNDEAQYLLGQIFFYGMKGWDKRVGTAVERFKQSANNGNEQAQLFLGNIYMTGAEVEENIKEAMYWYKKSAEQGNADAQFIIAGAYFQGNGVSQDLNNAFYWMLKSAENNVAKAYYYVANFYDLGTGVQQDLDKAIYWYQKAIISDPEMSDAYNNIGVIYVIRGSEFTTRAHEVPVSENIKYDELIANAKVEYNKAIPYFKDYMKFNPEKEEVKGTLDQLYDFLGISETTGIISGDCENGYGVYSWADGNKYEGEFLCGKENGQGTLYYSNGNKYVGSWKDGNIDGYGTYYLGDVISFKGEYKNYKRIYGTEYDNDGKTIYEGEYIDGKIPD